MWRGDEESYLDSPLLIKKEEQMEELSLGVKIIAISICIAVFILLITYDKLIKMLRRSPKSNKTK
jgi:hypothetical protein